MKKRVNLFSQRIKIALGGKYFGLVRKIVNLIFAISLVLIFILFGVYYYLSFQINNLNKKQLIYKGYISTNQKFSKDIQKLTHKLAILKKVNTTDAEGYLYYSSLLESLGAYGFDTNLSSFNIDNTREANFAMKFKSYDEAISFLTLLENETITDKFETISLESFDITQKSDEEYSVSIDGKFKDINATNNN